MTQVGTHELGGKINIGFSFIIVKIDTLRIRYEQRSCPGTLAIPGAIGVIRQRFDF
jgi:hypothetical protein